MHNPDVRCPVMASISTDRMNHRSVTTPPLVTIFLVKGQLDEQ